MRPPLSTRAHHPRQDHRRVSGDRAPSTIRILEFQPRRSVLEDDAERAIIRVRTTAIRRVGGRRVRVVVIQAEVHVAVLVRRSQIDPRQNAQRRVWKKSCTSLKPCAASDVSRDSGIRALREGDRSMVNF